MNLQARIVQELRSSSLRDLAERIGMAPSAVRRIALGDLQSFPEIETLQRIAKALAIPVWLVIEMAGVDLELPTSPADSAAEARVRSERDARWHRLFQTMLDADPARLDALLDAEDGPAGGVR